MSLETARPCPCGSGEPSWWEYDGYGIPFKRVCPECEHIALNEFRPDIKERYDTDEQIEEDF